MTVRSARPDDLSDIHRLVLALADYEKESQAVTATTTDFAAALFPEHGEARVHCHVAEIDGVVVGLAIWCVNFSTWTGQHGIWLEDLFVLPEQRGQGIGKRLLSTLAGICVARGWTRLEWAVLDWNESSIGFYRSLGAGGMDDWTTYRMEGAALAALGGSPTEDR